jgi:hypothetical protein
MPNLMSGTTACLRAVVEWGCPPTVGRRHTPLHRGGEMPLVHPTNTGSTHWSKRLTRFMAPTRTMQWTSCAPITM